jgi:transcriptional regulator with XRE-family HTH domain
MSHPPDDSTSPPGSTQSLATPSTSSSASTKRLSLGERMRIARYAARLTQEELAGDSFSKSYISAVERNKMTPSISALRLLAERLSVTLAYLLGEQEDDPVIQPDQEPAPNASLSPDEQRLAQRFEETEKLLMNNAPTLALDHLGDQAAVPPQHLAHWNWLAGWALLQLNQAQEAKDIIQQGFEAAQASHDLRAEGFLYFTLAKVNAVLGEQATVDHAFQEAIRRFEQGSDYHMLLCVYDEYGAFLAQQGRYQEAYAQMRHAQAVSAHLQSKR